jgi:hypothetical protein
MSVRFELRARCWALLASCLSLTLACGGSGPKVPAGDAAVAVADARDAAPGDAAIEQAMPRPPDGAMDTSGGDGQGASGGGQDARDVSPEGVAAADALVEASPDVPSPCPVDCNHLPHVVAGTVVACSPAGYCQLPPGVCETGFAHCVGSGNVGCEADLSNPATCGGCTTSCSAPTPICSNQGSFSYRCTPVCAAPTPDACNGSCVDLQSDLYNCGSCSTLCFTYNAEMACIQGQCTFVQCNGAGTAHCAGDIGCDTMLGTDLNCAGCGDRSCAIANTLLSCRSANACTSAVCAPGFANCDTTSPDCEAGFAAGATCLPTYLGTTPLATQSQNDAAAAVGTDGSFFVAGSFSGTVDFDPSAGQDIRATATPDDTDGFITKINADGSYGWTRTFAGRGAMSLHGLGAAAGGAIVAVGSYTDTVDLDPGSGADLHQTGMVSQQDALVVKLAADGSFVWGKTFAGTDFNSVGDALRVAVDGADAVYAVGTFTNTVDFDPGPGTAVHTAAQQTAMLVKLTAAGAFSWVQTVGDGACADSLDSVAVATDGSVWGTGDAETGPGCAYSSQFATAFSGDLVIVSYSAAGASRGLWTLGGGSVLVNAAGVAAGPNGSVYVGGASAGVIDLDPGPGVANRWAGDSPGGFILKLGSEGGFNWAQAIPGLSVNSIASTADGGVLGAGSSSGAFVTKLNSDGTSAWTFLFGGPGSGAQTVAAQGGSFVVAGTSSGSGDFDPGAGIDVVFGDIIYLSRFSF